MEWDAKDVLAALQQLEAKLPLDLRQKMGSFCWAERLGTVHLQEGLCRVHFFSDGLALADKMGIENIIKESVDPVSAGASR